MSVMFISVIELEIFRLALVSLSPLGRLVQPRAVARLAQAPGCGGLKAFFWRAGQFAF